MKTLGSALSLALMALSFPIFASKTAITGQPITLETHGKFYSLPKDYKALTSYYYVTINGVNKVCYFESQPDLASLSLLVINIKYEGHIKKWNCYPLDQNFFEITP